MDTVTLTIDGKPVTVERGTNVLQAAIEQGIRIPFYCYHPGLRVNGSCRICLVKIEKMPKLQTACSTACIDGMVVYTGTPDVLAARASVFEFLLVNHPLDCPVCDKGGECPLQDYAYSFGPKASRMDFPRRVFDGDGVRADVDFGPTLVLNRNRCILCTRCVRFMREIDGNAQISVVDRGNGSEIATFQEQGVHSLLSGNLADICPVGAITTRQYRFRSRPWDNAQVVDTICTQCSKGCSTTAWLRGKPEWAKTARLVRITPRFNPEVNGYWMCDTGRFEYEWLEDEARARRPMVRDAEGHLQPATWHDAMVQLAGRLSESSQSGLRFLASAHASLEELFLLKRIATDIGVDAPGVHVSWRYREKSQPASAAFRVPAVDAPNVDGARDLGLVGPGVEADLAPLRAAVEQGSVAALYVLDPGPEGSLGDVSWIVDARARGALSLLIVQGVRMTALAHTADLVLPGAAFVEKEASYTNDQGHVQGGARVMPPPGDAMEDWQILTRLAVALGFPVPYPDVQTIRVDIAAALAAGPPAYAGLSNLPFAKPVPVPTWLQTSNPSERWKWDLMYQDLPPVKLAVEPAATPGLDGVPPQDAE